MANSVLITGSKGYLGARLMQHLANKRDWKAIGIDIHPAQAGETNYVEMDIRSPDLSRLMAEEKVTHVVHLASVMKPGEDEAKDYDIDVNGTHNVLQACVENGVKHLTVTSSGAAYGYYADNPKWITEDDPLRGNDCFSYSKHKRLIENMLATYRTQHPALQQLILRPGTVLGANTDNLITNLFKKNKLLAIEGSDSPFVFIWDEDVVEIVIAGLEGEKVGAYNLAGDGAMTIHEIAAALGKTTRILPARLLQRALWVGKTLKVSPYGPEQLDFLRYRPVLSNERLKNVFGYTPRKTTHEVFEFYKSHNFPAQATGGAKPIGIITGAASGLGLDLVRALVDKYELHLIDRDQTGLARLQGLYPGINTYQIDLTNKEEISVITESLCEGLPGLDLLINNAGITHRSLVKTTSPEVIEKVMAVDYFAPVRLTTGLLPLLNKRKGKVVNIGSMAGWMPVLGRAGYCAAKSALHQFFETFRAEAKDSGVTVLMAYPSFLDTPIENNALNGSGGQATHPRSMVGNMRSSQWMASRIAKAIEKGDERLYGDLFTFVSSLLYKVAPRVYLTLMRKKLASELLSESPRHMASTRIKPETTASGGETDKEDASGYNPS